MRLRTKVAGIGLAAAATTAFAIGGQQALAATAEGTIQGAGDANAVAGSYIVSLRDSASGNVEGTAKALAGKYGGSVGHTYTSSLKGFSVKTGEAQAKRLAANPAVAKVQVNHTFRVSETQDNPPSWGLDRVDQKDLPLDKKYTYPSKADNVTAYIIDTGVRIGHKSFAGRATWGFNAVDNDNTDGHGHGTHVAGTVAGTEFGVAKGAKIVAVKVLNAQGSGTTEQVVKGIDWVTSNAKKPAVANMSLGGSADEALDEAVRKSIAAGVTYGVASGNSNADACGFSPARTKEAITVNASDNTDARASFSNFGTCTDIFAPGKDITSAWGTGDDATKTISGTSMATPHVVGAAALVLAKNPTFTPAQVADALVKAAVDGKVQNPGTGSPNKLLFVSQTKKR